jgi:hypothetical protein
LSLYWPLTHILTALLFQIHLSVSSWLASFRDLPTKILNVLDLTVLCIRTFVVIRYSRFHMFLPFDSKYSDGESRVLRTAVAYFEVRLRRRTKSAIMLLYGEPLRGGCSEHEISVCCLLYPHQGATRIETFRSVCVWS